MPVRPVRRRVQQPVNLIPGGMAQPNPPNPANLKVKFATFKGKSKKADPDAHVSQFGTKWEASGLGALYGDDVKKQQFAATLEGKAMN